MGQLRDSSGRQVDLEIDARTPCGPQAIAPCHWQFPDPRGAEDHGLIGEGADFEPGTILAAYSRGIFPWPHPETERLWFSPNPRAIIPLDGLRISQRLARTVRAGKFRVTVDAAFEQVMRQCAEARAEGTWITSTLVRGYSALHRLGWAHSVETWNEAGELVGGLYGVAIGAMFGAESMFHRETDASKVAMIGLMQHANAIGLELIDIQVLTPHTDSMGGVEISRDEYLRRLAGAMTRQANWAG